jgi:hypothetical protein
MSSIKISQLPTVSNITVIPSQTIIPIVDTGSGETFSIDAGSFASSLYTNEVLNVGQQGLIFPNLIAQFTASANGYAQINNQNFNSNGTSDYITTADIGNDSSYYIDLGITNSTYNNKSPYNSLGTAIEPLSGYLYVQGNASTPNTGNLVIGTLQSNSEIRFIVGGINSNNVALKISNSGLVLVDSKTIKFADGTTQNTAAASNAYSISTYNLANTVNNYAYSANTYLQANIAASLVSAQTYTDTANNYIANNYISNNSIINLNTVNLSGNLSVAGITQTASINTGNLSIVGTSSVSGNSIVYGNFIANGTSTLVGNVSMSGTSVVYGNFTANGTANLVGNITVTGTGGLNGYLTVNNSIFPANSTLMKLTASNGYITIPPSNQDYMLQITGKDGAPTRLILDSFGNGGSSNSYSVIAGRSARGTASTPSQTQSGDVLMRVGGTGYSNSGFFGTGSARIDLVAAENFTDSTKGSVIQFWTTNPGTNTVNTIATFAGNTVSFTGTVNPQKGFIYNPNVISSITNTMVVDIANNSLYKFNCNNTTTISLTGFTPGKVVEVWLVNLDTGGGSNHTITHGCQANNSTTGASSFTLTSLHAAYLRYFSIGGDLANTYVSINYS